MTITVDRHGILFQSDDDYWTFISNLDNDNKTWKSPLVALDALSDLGWEVVTACVTADSEGNLNKNPEYLLRKKDTLD